MYGVTRGLLDMAGPARVFDTLLDEQSILGLALGAGGVGAASHTGDPVPRLLSQRVGPDSWRRRHPAVLLKSPVPQSDGGPDPGYGYQKGFGGHFHNDNSIAAIRDIPGVVIASPARPDDAAAMLHTCVAAASAAGVVCVFLEPIALYHTRDLYDDGDDRWLARLSGPSRAPIGRARTYGDGNDLTILTFGNGVRMSLRVARRLERIDIATRVVDLRWLAPLPVQDMLREATATGRVLVVDETRETGGVGEGVLAALLSRRLHRRRGPSRQQGQLHPARRRRAARAAVRGHHRSGGDKTRPVRNLTTST